MVSKVIVVIGATGVQGRSVVDTFRKESSWTVRAVTRNESSEKAKALQAEGIQTVTANLDDPTSLDIAFKGASAIFSVTDFWGTYFSPENQAKAKPEQKLIDSAYELELQQGKNVFDAAAKVKTLERLVFSGLSHVSKWSKGKYKHVPQYEAKAVAAEYGQATYPELWKMTSIIQIGFYLENFLASPVSFHKKDESGVVQFLGLLKGDALLPFIAATHDTGPLTRALVEVDGGKNLMAYRGLITYDDFISLWSRTVGIPAQRNASPGDPGLPEFLVEEVKEAFGYMADFGYGGGDPTLVHPKDVSITPRL